MEASLGAASSRVLRTKLDLPLLSVRLSDCIKFETVPDSVLESLPFYVGVRIYMSFV